MKLKTLLKNRPMGTTIKVRGQYYILKLKTQKKIKIHINEIVKINNQFVISEPAV